MGVFHVCLCACFTSVCVFHVCVRVSRLCACFTSVCVRVSRLCVQSEEVDEPEPDLWPFETAAIRAWKAHLLAAIERFKSHIKSTEALFPGLEKYFKKLHKENIEAGSIDLAVLDADGDGKVDSRDLELLQKNMGQALARKAQRDKDAHAKVKTAETSLAEIDSAAKSLLHRKEVLAQSLHFSAVCLSVCLSVC